jgi:ribosomal protein S18 acetylase RimI-like enzyme
MTIRKLDLSHRFIAEDLWAMQHAAYRLEAERIGVSDLPPLRDTIQSLQNCGETFYGFHTEDGDLAGALSIEEEKGGQVVICRVMVDSDHQRQGIASLLLQHVLNLLPSGAVVSVTAEVRNVPAVRLYERNGFQATGTMRPAPDIIMLRFERTLT